MPPTEPTFHAYTKAQGAAYAQIRLDYHPSLYNTVLSHHTATGGKLDLLLDVGCGPGIAVSNLAKHFTHAVGLDPSQGMIETARSLAATRTPSTSTTSTGAPITFEVSSAEDLGSNLSPPIADNSVDLITVAMAAHWFDMPRFWASAARVLKPGGTVAIWGSGHMRVHPTAVPNAAAIQDAMDHMEIEYLREHFLPGNWLTRNNYAGLVLPWTVEPAVPGFERDSFVRREWGVGDEDFYARGPVVVDLDGLERMLGTSSPVTRWREANPDAVGTERDVIWMFRRVVERLLREAGVKEGEETVTGAGEAVLMLVKKEDCRDADKAHLVDIAGT
ncbi:putative S-adenosylmethionine-dependent methyltransferase [Aspergillus lucknowensis]|uniref:S-adenosyl-L-methionine-dependent methyltransferase n=1 Tax=Aspergillus lucknowensis TaxID=176173 RepID=A0ABR4LD20_9EURO